MDWRSLIMDIPDYPKQGIVFKDITPLLAHGKGFQAAIEEMAQFILQHDLKPDVLACPEARGFIFASALAQRLGVGFIPLRKPGKLPRQVSRLAFDLEYGQDVLEVHTDDVKPKMKVVMVDDVLATGGTMSACMKLFEDLGAEVIGACFLLEIKALCGRDKLKAVPIGSLIEQ